MNKIISGLLLLFLLFSSACAEEPLMRASQSDPAVYTSEAFREHPPVYNHPRQYTLRRRPLASLSLPAALLSETFGPVTAARDHSVLAISSAHPWFGPSASQYMAPAFPLPDSLPADRPEVRQLQNLLKDIGWSDVSDPDLYCSARQMVQSASSPIFSPEYYTRGIPEDSWDSFFFLHFLQKIDGYPLSIWMENASEEDFETFDANFVLDADGCIVTGRIFPGYEVVSSQEITEPLISAEEAGKLLMEDRRYRYSESRTWKNCEHYEFSWEITGFEPGLALTHSGTAFPCWWIEYDFVITDENTGEQFRIKEDYVINAVNGKG